MNTVPAPLTTFVLVLCFAVPTFGQSPSAVDEAWMQSHLKPGGPRLIWQPGDADLIRERVP